ncbi:hypothetical protein TanjilG_23966 [Lupinus angustifolius]|uniref:Inhibitor of growth protein N-terminal histone-binding domain-containing protein n=1 Tax=Lupinus angustifolius TaxID=3871 RepID=A0A1J7HE16_LUPAN|nr:hypothetical protein TanjilG_23966 [Lupinus angustifolius]
MLERRIDGIDEPADSIFSSVLSFLLYPSSSPFSVLSLSSLSISVFYVLCSVAKWTMKETDQLLLDVQRQNEQRCEQEIEDIRRGIRSGNITPDTSVIRFSDEALDEQKHSIRIADEKVALAVQTYDLVDTHIQQLDQYLKKFDEELRRERENAATPRVPASGPDGHTKSGRGSEGGRGGRKKASQTTVVPAAAAATEAQTTANPTGVEIDLPVDPNEPTYCLCNQVSYGEMVACDNNDCQRKVTAAGGAESTMLRWWNGFGGGG